MPGLQARDFAGLVRRTPQSGRKAGQRELWLVYCCGTVSRGLFLTKWYISARRGCRAPNTGHLDQTQFVAHTCQFVAYVCVVGMFHRPLAKCREFGFERFQRFRFF